MRRYALYGGVEGPDEKKYKSYLFGRVSYLFGRIRICSAEIATVYMYLFVRTLRSLFREISYLFGRIKICSDEPGPVRTN